MKTLADFKRALQPGTVWQTTHYTESMVDLDMGRRTVAIQQSNAVAFKRRDSDSLSWLYFPKSSEFEIDGDGRALIFAPPYPQWDRPRRLLLAYRKV